MLALIVVRVRRYAGGTGDEQKEPGQGFADIVSNLSDIYSTRCPWSSTVRWQTDRQFSLRARSAAKSAPGLAVSL